MILRKISIPLLLFISAFLYRIANIWYFGFDGLYGQDSYAYLDYTQQFLTAIQTGTEFPVTFWPVGYFLIGSGLSLLFPLKTESVLLMFSILTGSFSAVMIYYTSKEILIAFGKDIAGEFHISIAVISGILACFSGGILKSGITIMSDSPALLWVIISLFFLFRYFNKRKIIHLLFSFTFFSLGLITRYSVILIFPVLFFISLYVILSSTDKRRHTIFFLISFIFGFVIFLPQFFSILEHGVSYYRNYEGYDNFAVSWSPVNFFKKNFLTADGNITYLLPNIVYCTVFFFHPMFFSLSGFFLFPCLYFFVKHKTKIALLISSVWILPGWLYFCGVPMQALRFFYFLFPLYALIISLGIVLSVKRKRHRIYLLVIIIVAFGSYNFYHMQKFISDKNRELAVVKWVNENIPANSHLFSFEITGALNHYSKHKSAELYTLSEKKLIFVLDSVTAEKYFILPSEKLGTQWKDMPLSRKFNNVKEKYSLGKIAHVTGYTVYKTGEKF